jgi:hypothetical protein
MVSIIPGIEAGAPERTETSSGSAGSPKRRPASSPIASTAWPTWFFSTSGSVRPLS